MISEKCLHYFSMKLAKEIVDAIQNCDHMTALCMEGNTLGVDAAESIAKALGQHPEFQVSRELYDILGMESFRKDTLTKEKCLSRYTT